MAKAIANEDVEITAAGLSKALSSTSTTEQYTFFTNGAVVLAGNVTVTDDTFWVANMGVDILYRGSINLNGFTMTFFGYTLTQDQATAGNLKITPFNIGGAYVTTAVAGAGTAQIGTADIAPEAVTLAKMADLARGSIIVGGASNRPVALDVKTAGAFPIGDGTDIAAHTIAGDITVNSGGTAAIAAGVIVNADINANAGIEVTKFEAATDGQLIVGKTATGKFVKVAVGTDIVVAPSGVATIQAGVVTPEKASVNLTEQALPVFINFNLQDGEGKYSVTMGESFELLDVWINLDSDAAHNISVAMNINGVAVTGGVVSFTAGDPKNTNNNGTAITANNTGTAGDVINFILTVDPTETASGSVSLIYKKTS